MRYSKIKRLCDFIAAFALITALAPLMLVISVVIRLTMGKGVFFCQHRPGLHGKIFRMYKFRTMKPFDPENAVSDAGRITKVGAFLRASSLDELPELFNVLLGDMSLVGPRPLLVEYLERYSASEMTRHNVVPGITGLAQVRGRNNLSWRNKFKYDLFYVKNLSFFLDLQIIVETIAVVLFRIGFRSHGEPKKFGES